MMKASKITLKLRRLTHPAPERQKNEQNISSEKRKSFDDSGRDTENKVCSSRSEECMAEEKQDHSPRRHSCWAIDTTKQEYFPPAASSPAITPSINNLDATDEPDNFGTMERVLDFCQQWRRNSVLPPSVQDLLQAHNHPTGHRRITLASLPLIKTPSKQANVSTTPTESRSFLEAVTGRRAQFRRAWSLFSLTSEREAAREKAEKESRGKKEKPHQRILRPPTRHYYRRGISGLPIQCSPNSLRVAI